MAKCKIINNKCHIMSYDSLDIGDTFIYEDTVGIKTNLSIDSLMLNEFHSSCLCKEAALDLETGEMMFMSKRATVVEITLLSVIDCNNEGEEE